MTKLIFSGCSFTAGTGWDPDLKVLESKDSPELWCNLLLQKTDRYRDCQAINVGFPGASNSEIFEKTVEIMAYHNNSIDTVFCQWTSMPRYNFNVGFELWNTEEGFFTNARNHDHRLSNGVIWPREYVSDLVDRLKVMHHLHWEILKVVRFSNVLIHLAQKLNIPNIFFINGLCPWDKDYFIKLDNVKPESYTDFTKDQILNIDSRDDKDIYKLYELAHQHYQQAGGITCSHWINLYESMLALQIDSNHDSKHPGKKSNELYHQKIHDKLIEIDLA